MMRQTSDGLWVQANPANSSPRESAASVRHPSAGLGSVGWRCAALLLDNHETLTLGASWSPGCHSRRLEEARSAGAVAQIFDVPADLLERIRLLVIISLFYVFSQPGQRFKSSAFRIISLPSPFQVTG